jgi:4-hydroxy-tetrahydrodipicolinate reductase
VGTTGWHQELPRLIAMAKEAGIGMVYGANFSLGMNLFSRLIANAVELFNRFEDYDLLAWKNTMPKKPIAPPEQRWNWQN